MEFEANTGAPMALFVASKVPERNHVGSILTVWNQDWPDCFLNQFTCRMEATHLHRPV